MRKVLTIEKPDNTPDFTRLKAFSGAIILALGIIVMRLWFLQIVKGPELAALSETQRTRLIRRVASRGTILDRRGRTLATSRSIFVVSVIPDEINQNPQVVPRLAKMLHLTEEEIALLISTNKTTPFDPVPLAPILDGDMRLPSQIEEQKLDLPGVLITRDPVRYYTDGKLCAHVLGVTRPISSEKLESLRSKGYRGGDFLGVEGLEKTYETELRGKDGGQMIAVDARGRLQHTLDEIQPIPGHILRLSLDRDLQKAAYDALQGPLSHGHPGSAVALDPNTGDVLAFVSVPSYDLNDYGTNYGKLLKDPLKPLINRVSGSHYPCGSTFKLVTAAAGLETGAISRETREYCPGFMQLGNRTFHCDNRSGHGSLDLPDAIGQSCDVYFWRVAQSVGQQHLSDWARRFGLGAKTGIDLPVDVRGIVPSPAYKKKHRLGPWVPGDLIDMAIGQGDVGVSPLQLADYTAAIANGGTLWRPQIVHEVVDVSSGHANVIRRFDPVVRGRLGISQATRNAIVEGMARALEPKGTAYGLAVPGVSVAGKTGTAETHLHGRKASHSVFVCFAPIDHPKIAIAVLVEDGGWGATVAAPIGIRMLDQFFGRAVGKIGIGRSATAD